MPDILFDYGFVISNYFICICIVLCNNVLLFQSIRVKVIQNASTVEKRFSSWIGGSILASLVRINVQQPLLNVLLPACVIAGYFSTIVDIQN